MEIHGFLGSLGDVLVPWYLQVVRSSPQDGMLCWGNDHGEDVIERIILELNGIEYPIPKNSKIIAFACFCSPFHRFASGLCLCVWYIQAPDMQHPICANLPLSRFNGVPLGQVHLCLFVFILVTPKFAGNLWLTGWKLFLGFTVYAGIQHQSRHEIDFVCPV